MRRIGAVVAVVLVVSIIPVCQQGWTTAPYGMVILNDAVERFAIYDEDGVLRASGETATLEAALLRLGLFACPAWVKVPGSSPRARGAY